MVAGGPAQRLDGVADLQHPGVVRLVEQRGPPAEHVERGGRGRLRQRVLAGRQSARRLRDQLLGLDHVQ